MRREASVRATIGDVSATVFVPMPAEVLGEEYTARPVRVRSAWGRCRSRLIRRGSQEVILVLDADQCRALGLSPQAGEIELWLEVIPENLRLETPADLAAAIEPWREQWDRLPERDRHLVIGLVKEAPSAETRRLRIAIVASSLRRELP